MQEQHYAASAADSSHPVQISGAERTLLLEHFGLDALGNHIVDLELYYHRGDATMVTLCRQEMAQTFRLMDELNWPSPVVRRAGYTVTVDEALLDAVRDMLDFYETDAIPGAESNLARIREGNRGSYFGAGQAESEAQQIKQLEGDRRLAAEIADLLKTLQGGE